MGNPKATIIFLFHTCILSILSGVEKFAGINGDIIMRPSSLGGGRILRRTLSVRLSVCLSVYLSVRPSRYRYTSRHLANYNDTHVVFRTR